MAQNNSQPAKSRFARFAQRTAILSGHPVTFLLAVSIILLWAATGPFVKFSDTWQLIINTSTTIVTFLMVFLIQNTQNRDTGAIQVKLDELIRATKGAKNSLLDLEEMDDKQLELLHKQYAELARQSREKLDHRTEARSTKQTD